MRITDTSDLWWKTAVVYCLDVETFMDWNNDGTGDFPGLASRLDYLAELGVTCLWLMPFYPTPDRDDGYDVLDFYSVDSRLGSLGDLVEVIRTAKDRGMRVIADLVINHTSDQHPWFVSAKSDRNSPHRDYYVWRDEPPEQQGPPVFPDQETSNWEYDKKTKQYYQHIFYKHQPDLNVTNPVVRDEIAKIMGFWLELGLSGFRVDAVPFLLETDAVVGGDDALPDPHSYLRSLRAFLGRRSGDGVLLGEVNLPRDEQATYFGGAEGNELTMQFDFISMQKLYLGLARQDAAPLVEALTSRTGGSSDSQWANFVRNHDELTLDKLSDEERGEVFAAFGPEERMQVYGRGLVRRLPPMLQGDPRRIRMVYSLLFSLPGTPVLFYGEEIGMGENLEQEGRMAVRTPMQWNGGRNGGFSAAGADDLCSAVVEGGYGPQHVNVEQQRRDPDSLLSFVQTLVRHYRNAPEFGWGEFAVIDQPHASVLAHTLTWESDQVIALHNFGTESFEVPLPIAEADAHTRLSDLLTGESLPVEDGAASVTLGGYGYRWLRVVHEPDTTQY
ncbi:alpha-amylase family protein [Planctomonas psychrotolerans]|uniref:alpha-amylase family protein n=1 Tax=Planctomonas psychrotolerans TaxID=2528712 RepID=UPI001239F88E|nr:alpha-amylase family protein [Planctomonas psychrotolerans]